MPKRFVFTPLAALAVAALCSAPSCWSLQQLQLGRRLQLPPHAGYHGNNRRIKDSFFEGWYLRVVTKQQESIVLIFHIFDPHIRTPRQGVGLQVVTPKGTVVTNCSDVSSFRADSHSLDLRNFFPSGDENKDFFRLSEQRASGRATSTNGERLSAVFDFDILPTVGWGETLLADTETTSSSSSSEQFSTAGWLSAFPVFEPHYQVLISKGTTMGSLTLKEEHDEGSSEFAHYDLDGATMYLEKNWGRSFPSRWWWIQANTFVENKDLSITSTAARRQLPFFAATATKKK